MLKNFRFSFWRSSDKNKKLVNQLKFVLPPKKNNICKNQIRSIISQRHVLSDQYPNKFKFQVQKQWLNSAWLEKREWRMSRTKVLLHNFFKQFYFILFLCNVSSNRSTIISKSSDELWLLIHTNLSNFQLSQPHNMLELI